MRYKTKYIKFLSDGSSYFYLNKSIAKQSAKTINKIDFINYGNTSNLRFQNLTEANKYLNVFRKYNFKK